MSFISKIIPSKKVIIIDIGTYRVKVAVCEFKNNEVHLLSYSEKKQETQDIAWSEVASIEWVGYTLSLAVNKALQGLEINPKDIVLNLPTTTTISSAKNIRYTRSDPHQKISLPELDYIISKAEAEAIADAKKQISQKTGYLDVDMKLITSSITDMYVDGFKVSNPLWFTGREIELSVLNIFIPASRYHIIESLGNHLGKNILSIIPLEFSLPKLLSSTEYAYENVLLLDIGNTKTSLIIQKAGVIIWFDKINIGITDLIKSIKQNHDLTTVEIIKNIDKKDTYLKEKQEFLWVWEEWFIIMLKELLPSSLTPHLILLSGGWDNTFMREHIKSISLNQHTLHSLKPFSFIDIDFTQNIDIPEKKYTFNKTHLWLFSMILTTKEIIQYKNNPIFWIIENFLEKNKLS